MLHEAEQRGIDPETAIGIAGAILSEKVEEPAVMRDDPFAGYQGRRKGAKPNGGTAPALWVDADPGRKKTSRADPGLRPAMRCAVP